MSFILYVESDLGELDSDDMTRVIMQNAGVAQVMNAGSDISPGAWQFF